MKKIFLLITTSFLVLGQSGNVEAASRRSIASTNPQLKSSAPIKSDPSNQTVSARAGSSNAINTINNKVSAVIAARAGTKQNVVQTGVGVSAATTNTTVNDECKTKYYGCMDSFCMLENDNGGRCGCSDKKADLDNVLVEIEKLDAQTRNMATTGVEKIGLGTGDKADYVLNTAKDAAKEFSSNSSSSSQTEKTKSRASLDLSIFDTEPTFGFDDETATVENADLSLIQNKTGDNLHNASRNICVQQMPECSKDIRMLQMMYAQTIQSDCRSYENYLKKMKNESAKKVQVAEQALRNAALESYENANKWDLGQCVIEMRRCMQDEARGACGNDWTGCVGIVAAENAKSSSVVSRSKPKTYNITGSATKIQIAASTYDALLSKRPLCESVTNNCVNAVSKDKDAVWNAFVREIAPSLKSAELLAEADRRTNCIGNISECFRKGCMDTIDPNDQEGSFDMCISQPEAMLDVCKVQLNECGISTASEEEATKSTIWNYVVSKLLSMRVDSCTKEVKSCLQSEDRCGEDYAQCWGLDFDAILSLCPEDKLVACKPYDEDYKLDVISGIMLNIDNNLLTTCQAAVDEKMTALCGDGVDCSVSFSDETFGSESLAYDALNPNKVVVTGLLDFSKLTTSPDGKSVVAGTMAGESQTASNQGLQNVAAKINHIISMLTTDNQIQACVEGRNISQVTGTDGEKTSGRFPNLLDNYIPAIITYGLEAAQKNYNIKLDSLKKNAMTLVEEKIAADKAAGKDIKCLDAAVLPSK